MAEGTPVDFLFEPPIVYIWIVAAILIGVWYILKRAGLLNPSWQFKGETLEEIIVKNNIKPFMKVFSRKTKGGKLITHFNTIKLTRVAYSPMSIKVKKKDKNKEIFETVNLNMIFLKKGGGIFEDIPILKWLHPKVEYFVIEDRPDYIRRDSESKHDLFYLADNVYPHTFGTVWLVSEGSLKYLTELTYKRTQEHDKEESTNALKRFIFYNDKVTGATVQMERKAELEDEKYKKMREPDTS